MWPDYMDIRGRLGEPLWWDDRGVPRYVAFHPSLCDPYAEYIAYLEVACQHCGRRFRVAKSVEIGHDRKALAFPRPGDVGSFHYGDPPRHACIGDTMNAIPLRVLTFWQWGDDGAEPGDDGWSRLTEYEVGIPDGQEPDSSEETPGASSRADADGPGEKNEADKRFEYWVNATREAWDRMVASSDRREQALALVQLLDLIGSYVNEPGFASDVQSVATVAEAPSEVRGAVERILRGFQRVLDTLDGRERA